MITRETHRFIALAFVLTALQQLAVELVPRCTIRNDDDYLPIQLLLSVTIRLREHPSSFSKETPRLG